MKQLLIIGCVLLLPLCNYAQQLEAYYEMAAKSNPGLRAAYKDFEAAMARVEQDNALPNPSLSFGYFISPVETRVGPQRARLSLSQMFPWFGTLKAKADVATLEAEARYQLFLNSRNKLYYQVAEAYYPMVELDALIQLEKENARILKTYKSIATSNFENGKAPLTDALQVDLMLKEAESTISIMEQNKEPLQVTLNALMGREADEPVEIDTLVLPALPANTAADSILTNPALAALSLQAKAQEAREELAYKQGLPSLGVGIDYMIVGKRTDLTPGMAPPADNGKDALMPMVTVGLPLFRGKYNAARKEARLLKEKSQLLKEEELNQLNAAYSTSVFDLSKYRQQSALYTSQIEETERVIKLLFTSYSNTDKDFEDILLVQQQLLNYKKMRVRAMVSYFTTLAKLNYITAKDY